MGKNIKDIFIYFIGGPIACIVIAGIAPFAIIFLLPYYILCKLNNINMNKTIIKDGEKKEVFDIGMAVLMSAGIWLFVWICYYFPLTHPELFE